MIVNAFPLISITPFLINILLILKNNYHIYFLFANLIAQQYVPLLSVLPAYHCVFMIMFDFALQHILNFSERLFQHHPCSYLQINSLIDIYILYCFVLLNNNLILNQLFFMLLLSKKHRSQIFIVLLFSALCIFAIDFPKYYIFKNFQL